MKKKIKLSGELNNRNEKIKFSPRKSTSSSSSPITKLMIGKNRKMKIKKHDRITK
jgi:hypothetical protein